MCGCAVCAHVSNCMCTCVCVIEHVIPTNISYSDCTDYGMQYTICTYVHIYTYCIVLCVL